MPDRFLWVFLRDGAGGLVSDRVLYSAKILLGITRLDCTIGLPIFKPRRLEEYASKELICAGGLSMKFCVAA